MITHDKCGAFEEKITELDGKLNIALQTLEYYGNKDNWMMDIDGREEGEAAREALTKIKDFKNDHTK